MTAKKKSKGNLLNDFYQFGKYLKKRIQYMREGKSYILEAEDMPKLGHLISFTNRLVPYVSKVDWLKNIVDPLLSGRLVKNPLQVHVVPLNAKVKTSPSSVIPYQLIDEVIEKSSYRLVLHTCMCRQGMECKDYPHDFACLFLGEAAKYLGRSKDIAGREVTVEEAKEHVRRAEELGLVPLVAYVPAEHTIFGIPPDIRYKFLEICFCCPCCCIGLHNIRYLTPGTRKNVMSVGFVAKALPTCKGCFDCIDICPADAVHAKGDKVWVNEDLCVGCGLCQYKCEHHAIRMVQIDPPKGKMLDYFKGIQLDVS